MKKTKTVTKFKIDFSFRREVFFIIAGALMGAIVYEKNCSLGSIFYHSS
jgi:hypothetical protein